MPLSPQRQDEFEAEVRRRTNLRLNAALAGNPGILIGPEEESDAGNQTAWDLLNEPGWEDVRADWEERGFYDEELQIRQGAAVDSLHHWKLQLAVLDARYQAPAIRAEIVELIAATVSTLPPERVPDDPACEDVDRVLRQIVEEASELEEFVRTDGAQFMAGTGKEDCAKLAELMIVPAEIMEEVWGRVELERIWALRDAYGKALKHRIEERRRKRRGRKG
jgi:hypothetical protein